MSENKNNSPSKYLYFISFSYFMRGMMGFGNDIVEVEIKLKLANDFYRLEDLIRQRHAGRTSIKILFFQEIKE